MIIEICIAAVIAGLALLALHWLPWGLWLGRELPRPAAYIVGTLAMVLPLTGLFAGWSEWMAVLALWSVVVVSGMAVLLAYLFDAWLHNRQAREETEERERAMVREINHDADVR